MWYWRQENFEGLADVAASTANVPELRKYSEYCRLRECGLRKDALSALNDFIHATVGWEVHRRREFVDSLLTLSHNLPEIYELIPHPLHLRLIEPTIASWVTAEPHNPIPHRWLGTAEGLRDAIRLDPTDQIALRLLITRVIGHVGFAIHEYPAGYLGDAEEDANDLEQATRLAEGLLNLEVRDKLLESLVELSVDVDRYRRYVEENSHLPFAAWWKQQFGSDPGESAP